MSDISNAYVGDTTITLKWIFKKNITRGCDIYYRNFYYVDLIIQ